ncbi:single-stranded-DNA-specific exonuclease RecJ [bacterium]|nr:single-stranded-DNA-specific exonuclease RecJ [bacterium]
MKKEWIIKKVSDNSKSVLERLLEQRGITKPEDVKEFLNPEEFNVISPYAFCDMKKAADRISKAVNNGEKILIYGDFDADGITSTSLLIKTFMYINADVDYFIPEREKHGHGLNFKALVKVMAKRKPKLIITVDCGISNVKEVQQLKAFGVDVIVTDHHEAQDEMPNAVAIINPKAPYKLDENLTAKQILSLTSLAGVGVAFKLACAVLQEVGKSEFLQNLLPFVALGTISDIVPLIHENRYLVVKGLELISNGAHYGIRRLLEEAGYKPENGVTSEQIAFGVTPRINATGRLDNVDDSVRVLISENKSEIDMAILSLNNCNCIRQELCEKTFLEAKEMKQNKNSIILFNNDWHVGIIGIVASKLVETYNKPTFLMTFNKETNQYRCSARGVLGVNIFEILQANSDLFDNFGGHTMAGGCAFDASKHSFEEVKSALDATINEMLGGKELKPTLEVDLELMPDEINLDLVEEIDRMQPFGADNPSPVFAVKNLKLLQKKLMGSEKNHLKLILEDNNHDTYTCIWWSRGDIPLIEGDFLDVAFCPQINVFNGNTNLQLIVLDIHSDKIVEEVKSEFTIYDHRKKTGIFSSIEDYLKTTKLKIGVFAEDSDLLQELRAYPQIFQRCFARTCKTEYDAIMFFDYPASNEVYEEIIKNTNAKILHFMNYESKNFDEQEYLKKIAGMIKYSCNHYNGIFNIKNAAAKLAVCEDMIIETLNALDSVEVIEITDKAENSFEIRSFNSDYSKILHSELYSEILTEQKMVSDFKSSFASADLNYFCNIS